MVITTTITIKNVITNLANLIVWLMFCVYGETFPRLWFDNDNNKNYNDINNNDIYDDDDNNDRLIIKTATMLIMEAGKVLLQNESR